ncbi:MAG TPA: His/Gly/Thr/Pro-type tRNA ligase C-terminal domain-containing protein, partial [bacterium]|nr:His/Gly/Thr/Pro-type tRNA ligase C-terminal domain-containing protein [bacterium]
GVIVEHFNDERGIIWPKSIAPFNVHLIAMRGAESQGENLYKLLQKEKVEVLLDDREGISAGEKFASADLIGCPYRLVVSPRIGEGKVEVKKRTSDKVAVVPTSSLKETLDI